MLCLSRRLGVVPCTRGKVHRRTILRRQPGTGNSRRPSIFRSLNWGRMAEDALSGGAELFCRGRPGLLGAELSGRFVAHAASDAELNAGQRRTLWARLASPIFIVAGGLRYLIAANELAVSRDILVIFGTEIGARPSQARGCFYVSDSSSPAYSSIPAWGLADLERLAVLPRTGRAAWRAMIVGKRNWVVDPRMAADARTSTFADEFSPMSPNSISVT